MFVSVFLIGMFNILYLSVFQTSDLSTYFFNYSLFENVDVLCVGCDDQCLRPFTGPLSITTLLLLYPHTMAGIVYRYIYVVSVICLPLK